MTEPVVDFAMALQQAAQALQDAARLQVEAPEAFDSLVPDDAGSPFHAPWDTSGKALARWAHAVRSHVPGASNATAPLAGLAPDLAASDTATAFVAALGRAVVALTEANRCWTDHADAIEAVVAATGYPACLPSFDEFISDFLAWVEAIAERHAARQSTSSALRRLSTYEGLAAKAAAAAGPPFGPGWDAKTVGRITRFEIWGTSFTAPEDYCEFRGFAGAWLIRAECMPGY